MDHPLLRCAESLETHHPPMMTLNSRTPLTPDIRLELSLLIACSTPTLSADRLQQIQDLVRAQPDWGYLMKAAVQHRIVPLLYQGLHQACPQTLPHDIEAFLNRHCQVNTLKNLFLDHKRQEIMGWFEVAKIPAIAYKGPTLAKIAYGSLALRQFTDLDFLVHPQDFDTACTLLESKEFKSSMNLGWEAHFASPDQQINIDLHRSLVPDFFGMPAPVIDPSNDGLSPESLLLLLAIQFGKDCCHWKVCLSQLCDIAALLHSHPDLNFDAVQQQAKSLGSLRFLWISLILVQDFLQIDLPPTWQSQLPTTGVEQQLAQWVRQRIAEDTDNPTIVPKDAGFWYFLGVYNHRFYLRVRERFQDKVIYCSHWAWQIIRMSLKPNAADRALMSLPKGLHFLYVFIHIGRLLYKYSIQRFVSHGL